MAYPRGLGDATSDFNDAKAKLEAVTGIPYTGTATDAGTLLTERALLIRIANGDTSAVAEGLGNDDPFVRGIAANYAKQLADYSPQDFQRAVVDGAISPDQYRAITGKELNQQQWWRDGRFQMLVSLIPSPAVDAAGIVHYGSVGGEVLASGSLYDYNFDFGSIHQPTSISPRDAGQSLPAAPSAPSGPPSGWRFNGSTGWWGPDGLFYPGTSVSTPWDGNTAGVSVTTYTEKPPAPAPSTSPTAPIVTGSGAGLPTGGSAPTAPTWNSPAAPTDHSGTPTDHTDTPTGQDGPPVVPAGIQDGGGDPSAPGGFALPTTLGASVPLLLGAGLLVAVLMGSKRR